MLTTPLATSTALISRLNPLAKLFATLMVTITAFLIDSWPILVAYFLLWLACLPLLGISYGRLVKRTWFIPVAAIMLVVINTLYAADKTGTTLWLWGPIHVTADALNNSAALGMRMLIVATVSIIGFATSDPTDLSDNLIQKLKFSPRFTIGTLAALRMLPLLHDEWIRIESARRARGMEGRGSIVRRTRLFISTLFTLLVISLRRAVRLAKAIEARGFVAGAPRSNARTAIWRWGDTVLVLITVSVSIAFTVWWLLA